MHTFKPLALAAALSLSLLALPAAHAAGGTLTVAPTAPGDPGSFDPIDTFLVAWGSVGSQIYDGLTMRGADMKLMPGLATKWELLDNDTRIRFTLRQGVKFHDGEPFNADAVKFTFDRLLGDEGKKGPQQSNYNAIKTVNVIDEHTVDFILGRPDPVLLTKLAGYGAMIVPPKYIKEKGDDYFNTHPVGTGPFRFVGYEPKISLTLERNPDYWGGAPKLEKLVYRYITEPSTQASELLAGRIDIAANIPLSMAAVIEKDKNLEVKAIDGPTTVALRYDTRDGITADKAVRQALTMAVDRDAIIKQILLGYAVPAASFQGKLSFGHDPDMKLVPFDPAKAKAILKEHNVKPGAAVQIDYRGSDQNFREVAQAVAGYLQAAGLKPMLKGYETNVLLNDIIPNGKTGNMWQNTWGGWTFDYDNTAYAMYHSGEKWNPYDKDAKLDALLEEQRGTFDADKRLKILREVARYVQDEALEMPLYNLKAVFGVNRRVKNLTIPADGRFRFIDEAVE